MNRYLIVNYHYIRDEQSSGINACRVDHFAEQINFLSSQYSIVTLQELYDNARKSAPGNFCSLTFDDGLVEHYAVAYKFLREKGLPGAFFIIGMPLQEQKIPLTHKLHLLLSHKTAKELVSMFHSYFHGRYLIDDSIRINPRRRFDDVLTSNLKETLIGLPITERQDFIENVFKDFHKSEAKLCADLFMSPSSLKEMGEHSMEIGSHGYSHRSLETLSFEEQKADIEASRRAIGDITGKNPMIFSYPHGRYNDDTIRILNDLGFSMAVILGGRAITNLDERFSIPRYDTNDIKII
ncbi:MAG: polysaccharide deacetylase family protein [Patescibacteria group bacterium]